MQLNKILTQSRVAFRHNYNRLFRITPVFNHVVTITFLEVETSRAKNLDRKKKSLKFHFLRSEDLFAEKQTKKIIIKIEKFTKLNMK